MKIAIAYIPVVHKGYLSFLDALSEQAIEELYIIGDDILENESELDYINRKDRLRAVPLEVTQQFLSSYTSIPVRELNREAIKTLQSQDVSIVTPREDIGRVVVERYFPNHEVTFLDIFLRWHKDNIGEDVEPDAEVITLSDFQQQVFQDVLSEATNSFDWWRQVGAALVKEGEVAYLAYNEHLPEDQQPYINGDTRSLFKRGININYSTTAHAEATVIALAAKDGVSTEGAELYATDFPCPYCARIIAKSGIKKVYFLKGYAVLEGDVFLREAGVEVIKVQQ